MIFELNDIHLESTTACSAKCFMCPHDELNRKGEMDFELFKKIVDDAIALGCKRITPFRIGDPLLFKDLFKWIEYVKDIPDVYVSLFTNASNLNRDMWDKLLEYWNKLMITISFHGYDKESYEKNMCMNFEKVRGNIIGFMEQNKQIPVNIYALLPDSKQEYIDEFQTLWHGQGFNGVSAGGGFMEWTGARHVAETRLDLMRSNPEKYHRVPCDYVMHHMDVMYDGKVCLCCVDYQGEVIFGDLEYQSIMDVYNGRLYQYWIEQHLKNGGKDLPLCKDCSMNVSYL